MEITWEVGYGYMGKSRPKITTIDDEKLLYYETADDAFELICEYVQEDFIQQISWCIRNEDKTMEEVSEFLKAKDSNAKR